jgi:hypothetical protein
VTFVDDLLAPVWAGLSAAQRSSWHSFGANTPLRNRAGKVVALNGWQAFVSINGLLAVGDTSLVLTDPPSNLTPPAPIPLSAFSVRLVHKGPDGKTYRQGRIYLELSEPTPTNRLIILLNNRARISPWSRRPWYATKRTAILPGSSGVVDLTARVGYTVAGTRWLRRMRIEGPGFLARPGGPPIKAWTVSTENGMRTISTLAWNTGHLGALPPEHLGL